MRMWAWSMVVSMAQGSISLRRQGCFNVDIEGVASAMNCPASRGQAHVQFLQKRYDTFERASNLVLFYIKPINHRKARATSAKTIFQKKEKPTSSHLILRLILRISTAVLCTRTGR